MIFAFFGFQNYYLKQFKLNVKTIFLTALVILSACGVEKEVPQDLISTEDMVKLLTEIHILESKVKNLPIPTTDSAKVVYAHYEKMLFTEFNITKEQYENSFTYYVDNSDEFSEIYEAVVDSLMQREKISKD